MAYADYKFYTDTYKGTLSEAAFGRLSERASDYIDARTNYVLKKGIPAEYEERVRKCCCALAETINSCESGGVKSSETVEGYSVSYVVGKQSSSEQRMNDTIQRYLSDLIGTVSCI